MKETRRVLVFYEAGFSFPDIAIVDQEIRKALDESPYQVELYTENMDEILFPDESSQQEFREWYIHKYRDHKPDLIIAEGPPPIKFMAAVHERFFPGTPIVFCCSPQGKADDLHLDSGFTGTWMEIGPAETLEVALRLQPGTKHVVVVGGVSSVDRNVEKITEGALRKYEGSLEFTYLTDLELPALLERLRRLPNNTIIFYTSLSKDAAGTSFIDSKESLPMILSVASAPVFVMSETFLGRGEVGGSVTSFSAQGRLVGEIAMRILRGEKPQNIHIVKNTNIYMFDWLALKRWGLKESNLPPSSIVLNRHFTVWDLYKQYIIGGIALILAEALLIFGLLWQRSRRRKVEEKLHDSQGQLAGVVGSAMDAIIAIDEEQRIVLFNASAENMFQCTAHDAIRSSIERFIPQRFRTEHRGHVRRFGETGVTNRSMGTLGALWAMRSDGEEFPIEASISQLDAAGKKLFTVIIRDVTERRKAEATLRESEERFRLVTNAAPVMIWMSGPDKLYTFFNQGWLDFTGRLLEQEIGEGWSAGVHPDDLKRRLAIYSQAFDARVDFKMEYRLRRFDGEFRWIVDYGVPRFEHAGSFVGYIGSCLDITESKHAQEELQKSYAEVKRLEERLQAESEYLQEEIKVIGRYEQIVGQSKALRQVLNKVEQVAGTDSIVLITGESGTGKELVARAIHAQSKRKDHVMVKVDCASLPPTLIESELFGREKGAYSGALTSQIGRVETADRSTLFLDEIGELGVDVQAKLLRVVQDGEFERLGTAKTAHVNVRIIAATHRDLAERVKGGTFREDLFYRLNVFPIHVPPLRERSEDIPLLVIAFLREFEKKMGKRIPVVPSRFMDELRLYPWPGNVRELRNAIERAVIITKGERLNLQLPKTSIVATTSTLKEAEAQHILSALEKTSWRIKGPTGAAMLLGMKPSTLYSAMRRLQITNTHKKGEMPS